MSRELTDAELRAAVQIGTDIARMLPKGIPADVMAEPYHADDPFDRDWRALVVWFRGHGWSSCMIEAATGVGADCVRQLAAGLTREPRARNAKALEWLESQVKDGLTPSVLQAAALHRAMRS